ncbi:hypothetical protein BASA60_000426 [Batrachochytrium salamandrivorans]|nr:hypothetical protein BASA60_000426 [Batrachochytrium salamandrivorans]
MASAMVNMEEYFRVNVERKLFIKVPEQEDHDLTPATRLLERRREIGGKNWLAKESQLKDSLLKFDKFLKENDAKRMRALKKSMDERKLREQKELEIGVLKSSITDLGDRKDRQGNAVDINIWIQRYLESVLASGNDFSEIKDIISRFDTLSATYVELVERARTAQERTEKDRQAFLSSSEEKNNVILGRNNEVARLQTKLEEVQIKSAKWQAELDQMIKNATQKSLLLGQVKMATSNLFNIVKLHLDNRLSSTPDVLEQLDKIDQFIVDLNQITADTQIMGMPMGKTMR